MRTFSQTSSILSSVGFSLTQIIGNYLPKFGVSKSVHFLKVNNFQKDPFERIGTVKLWVEACITLQEIRNFAF